MISTHLLCPAPFLKSCRFFSLRPPPDYYFLFARKAARSSTSSKSIFPAAASSALRFCSRRFRTMTKRTVKAKKKRLVHGQYMTGKYWWWCCRRKGTYTTLMMTGMPVFSHVLVGISSHPSSLHCSLFVKCASIWGSATESIVDSFVAQQDRVLGLFAEKLFGLRCLITLQFWLPK